MNNGCDHETTLRDDGTFGLGGVRLLHPPGTFPITPASRITIQAIGTNKDLLRRTGIDWGCGGGCLSIAAAKIPEVESVVGIDISKANVHIARRNAILNRVEEKARFFVGDSFTPFSACDRTAVEALKGQVNFVLANPPSSEHDDGFEYRRIVLRDAKEYLADQGVVFLNISSQYGLPRIDRLSEQVPGFARERVLASTEWVPFDLQRPDLLRCLESYAQEETRGGLEYVFGNPERVDQQMSALDAMAFHSKTGQSPFSKWQTHLFRYQR